MMYEYTIACDKCGSELEVGYDADRFTEYLRCARSPVCTFKRPIPEDVRMRAAGAPRLL